PKKNTIKFSPMKLKANPLDKIEYERIQWEGIKKEEESKKDKKEAKRSEGIISLHFNGKLLTIIINKDDKEVQRISFQAVSGRAEKINNKYYFTYEKERQMLKDKGPIPEGEYYIDMEKITEAVFYRNISWGKKNVPIELNNQETYGRDGFYIHGGWSAGSAGCIDLWDKNEMFFEKLIKLSKKFNAHRIPLVVEYKDSIMECSENLLGLIKQCEAKR
ncbi:tlde1 domain-containing protein, partial [Helicobacter ganmani]|uniref:tlde1 domain-containing protein n=1 Tax=Helicobacter ganmani TaxID=60246 RepID=UPI003A86F0D2